MDNPDILKNTNISLRALEPEDLEVLYRWENDPAVWHLSGTLVPYSRYLLKQYLENARKDIFELKQLRLIIQLNGERNGETRPVGAIDLFDFDPYHRRAGVGILVAEPSDRRKGYAREALDSLMKYCFDVLKLRQIWCNIAEGNRKSLKLFTSAGFQVVGEKKDWLFNGEGYESEWLLQFISPHTPE
ncbi:MAG: GNAT family N-acetyltransferase [Bacteroidota bacterium]